MSSQFKGGKWIPCPVCHAPSTQLCATCGGPFCGEHQFRHKGCSGGK